MRFFLAGCILLIIPISAFAQAHGEVESIGFSNTYRPACWTPMLVKLVPTTGETGTFQLQVIQEDLDGDRVTFTRTITLTGNAEGQSPREHRFWMYFLPEPTRGGLPARMDGDALKELQQRLHVFLCTEKGKELAELPITATINNVDASSSRGSKLVLAVTEGAGQPIGHDFRDAYGVVENVEMVPLRPRELPENVIGYEAVDAILWLNASPPDPNNPTEADRARALRDYVRQGGRLIISQPAEWQKTLAFGDLLPVNLKEVADVNDLDALLSIATKSRTSAGEKPPTIAAKSGPFKMAWAEAKPGALVADWAYPEDAAKRSPFIVRNTFGLGAVTWVAQDLSNPVITKALKTNWADVWDRVFDWNNDPQFKTRNEINDRRLDATYGQASDADLGQSFLRGMSLSGTSAKFVSVAVIFFILYFVTAGPGGWLYLLHKGKARQSWFLFAATALVAALLTVAMVKVLLRGRAQVAHLSLVRGTSGEPTIIDSRFGLYIPRDGDQEIRLRDNLVDTVSYVTPFAMHPNHVLDKDAEVLSSQQYSVPVHDVTSNDPIAIHVPYRSTLKKMQAHWGGASTGGIAGTAKLREQGYIEGQLTNGTGYPLRQVYFAFNYPRAEGRANDWVLYLPTWDMGATIELNDVFKTATLLNTAKGDIPESGKSLKGMIGLAGSENEWDIYWYRKFRGNNFADINADDSGEGFRRSFPMLSLFDRLPPVRSSQTSGDRFDLRRRGAQKFNMSQAVGAGQLVVLGQASTPLPLPLEVEGQTPETKDGTTFYQYVIPLDRSAVERAPTTRTGNQ